MNAPAWLVIVWALIAWRAAWLYSCDLRRMEEQASRAERMAR